MMNNNHHMNMLMKTINKTISCNFTKTTTITATTHPLLFIIGRNNNSTIRRSFSTTTKTSTLKKSNNDANADNEDLPPLNVERGIHDRQVSISSADKVATKTTTATTTTNNLTKKKKENLIVLGSGWAGFRLIKQIDLEKYNVNLVTPRNHFLFTPLLPGAACGTVELRSIIEPVRRAVYHEDYHYYEGSAIALDTQNQKVVCKPNYENDPNFTLPYDKLVIAIGCDVNDFGVPGVMEFAYPLKEISHARTIRQNIIQCFERAANPATPVHLRETLLHFVVVGAGPTGVEYSAELHDLIRDLAKNFPPEITEEVRLTVLEAGSSVLSAFDTSLQKYTQKFFRRNHIKIRTNQQVKQVLSKNSLLLQDGSVIDCGMIVWSAGIKPRQLPVSQGQPLALDAKSHKIIIDEYLRVKGAGGAEFDNIYAMGDVSVIENIPLAATAQVAQQQGLYLARVLNGTVDEKKPFVYHHMGQLAYIGNYRAISQVGALKSGGLLSWVFWRSAYLTRLVSIKNKFNVLLNWTSTFFFGRDISRF